MRPATIVALALIVAMPGATTRAGAAKTRPDSIIEGIDIEQRLGATLPLDARFTDADGRDVVLGDLLDGKPAILAFVYYECPMLCTLVLNGLVKALRALSMDAGDEFDVVAVSFDPGETADLAAAKKATYLEAYRRPDTAAGWHFLTGTEGEIARLTEAAGFEYVYDPERDEYGHAAALMIVTPDGQLARYLFGVEYSARDVRLALVEASQGEIGGIVDRLLLFCYHYDPALGRYSAAALNLVRAGGVATIAALAGFWIAMRRRERGASA